MLPFTSESVTNHGTAFRQHDPAVGVELIAELQHVIGCSAIDSSKQCNAIAMDMLQR